MNTETAIINYIKKISNGLAELSVLQARQIIEIVQLIPPKTAYAKLSAYNGSRNMYEPVLSIKTTDSAIKAAIEKALNAKPVEEVYLYECFNSDHEFEGKIYSAHPELFFTRQ